MTLLLLFLQDQQTVHNAMGAHTWFIILAVGAFLLWSVSYSLQLHKEALARKKGREELVRRKEELIDQIADLETRKEAGAIGEEKEKQESEDLKVHLAKTLAERAGKVAS